MSDLFDQPGRAAYAFGVIDTETSGLFPKEQADHVQNACRLASFAMVKCSPTWSTQSEFSIYVKPDGWKMHPEASRANGLTDEFLHANGRPVREALDHFIAALEEGRAIGAFNVKFDVRVMHAEMVRAGLPTYIEKTFTTCAMLTSIGVVRAKRDDGRIKTPKLHEAMEHFKIPQRGAHTALGDAISAMQILRMLDQIKINITPRPYATSKQPTQEKKFDAIKAAKEFAAGRNAPNWLNPTDET